jgi:hypothetical protein
VTGYLLGLDAQDLADAMGRVNDEIALPETGILVLGNARHALLRLLNHDCDLRTGRRPLSGNLLMGGFVAEPSMQAGRITHPGTA